MSQNKDRWSSLSMKERMFLMQEYVKNGITDLTSMRKHYNGIPYRDLNTSNYDYFNASPDMEPKKEGQHWGSRNSETGRILKREDHPTFDLAVKGENEAGYVIRRGIDGNLYSLPKNINYVEENIFASGGDSDTKNEDNQTLDNEGGWSDNSKARRERRHDRYDPTGNYILQPLYMLMGGNQAAGEENEYWKAYLGLDNAVPKMNPNAKTSWDDAIEAEKVANGELPSDFYGTTPRMDLNIQAIADTLNTGKILRNYDKYKEGKYYFPNKRTIEEIYKTGKKVLDNPNTWQQVEGDVVAFKNYHDDYLNESNPLGMLADFGMMWDPKTKSIYIHDTYDFGPISQIFAGKRPKEMKIRSKISFDPAKGSKLLRNDLENYYDYPKALTTHAYGGRILSGEEDKESTLSGKSFLQKLLEFVQSARDARVGAVGAQQVRDLYKKGKSEEASNLAKQYAKANTTGISLASGVANTNLLGDLLVTGATTAIDTLLDGEVDKLGVNIVKNTAADVIGHGITKGINKYNRIKGLKESYTGVPHKGTYEDPHIAMDENFPNYNGTIWTSDSQELAREYAKDNGKVFKVLVEPDKLQMVETPIPDNGEYFPWGYLPYKLENGKIKMTESELIDSAIFNNIKDGLEHSKLMANPDRTPEQVRKSYFKSLKGRAGKTTTDDIVNASYEQGFDGVNFNGVYDGHRMIDGYPVDVIVNESVYNPHVPHIVLPEDKSKWSLFFKNIDDLMVLKNGGNLIKNSK